jgi:hypothetical protein
MRAARSRGSRTRSPSSPNELIEKDGRRKSPATPGFLLGRALRPILRRETISSRSDLSDAVLPQARLYSPGFPRFNCETIVGCRVNAFQKNPDGFIQGYPIPLNKKTCARVVTYRQCADQHLEKTPRPLKRKDFMKIFLSSHGDYHSALHMPIRRADSDPCLGLAEGAALFCGREANSVGIQFPSTAVARKIRHAIT